MNKYQAFYKDKKLQVEANTTYEAQQKAASLFKAKKQYDVTILLIELRGKEYIQSTGF